MTALGGAKKIEKFLQGSERLPKISEGWEFQALYVALAAVDEFLAYLDAFHNVSASFKGSPPSPGGTATVPSAGVTS